MKIAKTQPLPRNYWYSAIASSMLNGKPQAVKIFGESIVIFRDQAGKPHALQDRCCHRGVPLSHGRVVGNEIACGYHGWQFDGKGACTHIPSLTEKQKHPKNYGVKSYPCIERDSYVWLWMGDADADFSKLAAIPDLTERYWSQGSVDMKCSALKVIENNLDWCHPYFAHPWTHGAFYRIHFSGFSEYEYKVEITSQGMDVFPATQKAGVPEVLLQFILPNRVVVKFSKLKMVIVLHAVPVDEHNCRMEWLATRTLPFGAHITWDKKESKVFAQDRILMEAAETQEVETGNYDERSVMSDTSTLMVRKIIAMASDNKWPPQENNAIRNQTIEVRS